MAEHAHATSSCAVTRRRRSTCRASSGSWPSTASGEEDDAFCSRFIAWDRACPDGEAARIVTEILSAGDAAGRIARFSDDAVQGAIRWMSELTSLPVAERAVALRARLTASDDAAVAGFVEFLDDADGTRIAVPDAAELVARMAVSVTCRSTRWHTGGG